MVDYDRDELEAAVQDVKAMAAPAEVSSTEDVEHVVVTAVERTGRVDGRLGQQR